MRRHCAAARTAGFTAAGGAFSCFGAIQENKMISSDAISSHSTDTAALKPRASTRRAAMASATSRGLAANVRWSARLGGAGVSLFTMQEVDSWVYSGSCERRLAEGVGRGEPVPAGAAGTAGATSATARRG